MNILIINHYAGSPSKGMEFRPYYFAREWIKSGHNVVILAASFSHLRRENIAIQDSLIEENIDGIKYIWIKTPKYEGNGFGRIRNMFSFIFKTYVRSRFFAETIKPDVVIASSTYPSDNYVARKIAHLANAKYIYEVHDLWPLSPMVLGNFSKYHPFIVAMQHAENFAYKNADAVVSMLPNTTPHMKQHGLDLKKWHYVPNGIILNEWKNPEPIPEALSSKIKELKEKNYFIVGYTGGHAPSNSLHTLVETAFLLKDNKSIFFLFVGNGIEKEKLIQQSKGLKNIGFFDSIPKLAIPNLLSQLDVGTVGSIESRLYKYGVSPNKLIDYMMAERPIIQHIDAGNDIVEKANSGISIEPENPQAIADAILRLKNMSKEQLEQLGKNGKEFVIKNHDYKILANKMLNIFTSQ